MFICSAIYKLQACSAVLSGFTCLGASLTGHKRPVIMQRLNAELAPSDH